MCVGGTIVTLTSEAERLLERGPGWQGDDVCAAIGDGGSEGDALKHGSVYQPPAPVQPIKPL